MAATIVGTPALVWGFGGGVLGTLETGVLTPIGAHLLTSVEWQSKPDDVLAEIEDMNGAGQVLVMLDGDYVVKVKAVWEPEVDYPTIGDLVLFFKQFNPAQDSVYDECKVVSVIRPSFTQKKAAEIAFTLHHKPSWHDTDVVYTPPG